MNYFEMLTNQPFVAHSGRVCLYSFGFFLLCSRLPWILNINIFWSWFYSCFILHISFWPNVSNLNHNHIQDYVIPKTWTTLFSQNFYFSVFSTFFFSKPEPFLNFKGSVQNNNKRKNCKIVWPRLSQKSLWFLFWQMSTPKRKSKVHVFSSKIA